MTKLVSMMLKDLQECRIIYKMSANRIVVVDNSPIIFRICINFAILLLQLDYPLIPQNKTKNYENQKQRLSKSTWCHQPYSLIFTHSQSLWHFWRRKSTFWKDKIPENFRRHIFKVQNHELNLSKNQNQFVKNWCHIHIKINVLFIIQGHTC